MTRIADLLELDLAKPVDEFVRIDNDDPDTVFTELTEYIATDRIQLEYERLLSAMATAKPGESFGVCISGVSGSGKSSFAKNLGLILTNREIRGVRARARFLERVQSHRIEEILDSFARNQPYEVFPVHVPSGPGADKMQFGPLMHRALLRGLNCAEPSEDGRTVGVQDLAANSFELCAARRPGQPFAFILDEVGDAIEQGGGQLENLCEIVGEFRRVSLERSKAGKPPGPVWIIVTGRRNPLARMFPHQVDLSDADIAEIARRRVLRKKEDQKPILRKLFQDFGPALIQNSRLGRSSRRTEFDQEQFVENYPYLPHLLDFSLDILAGLRLQPNAPKYVDSSNRTLVKQCFEMLLSGRPRLADLSYGALVSIDQIYDLVDGNTPWERQKAILDIRQRFDDDIDHPGMAPRVAKAICLMELIQPRLLRTSNNIAALLVRRVNEAPPALGVAAVLARMQAAQFVAERPDGWTLRDFDGLRRAATAVAGLKDAVGVVNPRGPGWRNGIIQFGKRALARSLTWYTRPLREFNAAVSRALEETVRSLDHFSMNMLALDQLSMKIDGPEPDGWPERRPRQVLDHLSANYVAIEQLTMDVLALEGRLALTGPPSPASRASDYRTTYLLGLFGTGRRYINELIQQNIGERAKYFRDAVRLHPGPTPMIYSGHATWKHLSRAQEPPQVMARIREAVRAGFADSIFIYRHPLDSLLTNWVWWRSYLRDNESVFGIAQAYKDPGALCADLDRHFADFQAFAEGRAEFYVGLSGPRFLTFAEFVEETELHLRSATLALRLEDFLVDPSGQFSRIAETMSVRMASGAAGMALPKTRAYGYRAVREKVPAFENFIRGLDPEIVRRIVAAGYEI